LDDFFSPKMWKDKTGKKKKKMKKKAQRPAAGQSEANRNIKGESKEEKGGTAQPNANRG